MSLYQYYISTFSQWPDPPPSPQLRSCYTVPDITLTPPSLAAFRGLWCPIHMEPEHNKEFSSVWAGRLIIPPQWGKFTEEHRVNQSRSAVAMETTQLRKLPYCTIFDRLEAQYQHQTLPGQQSYWGYTSYFKIRVFNNRVVINTV